LETYDNCGVIILSAGLSVRMGEPKAFLKYNSKQTFIEKIVSTYKDFGCTKISIVTNERDYKKLIDLKISDTFQVINPEPEKGRVNSIKLGSENLFDMEYVFIQNIDNPFITKDILLTIFKERENNKYVSPVYKGKGGHPILLHKNILTQIHFVSAENQNLKEILQPFDRKNVLMKEGIIHININSKSDYKNLIKPTK